MKRIWATLLLGLFFFYAQARVFLFALLRLVGARPDQAAGYWRDTAADRLRPVTPPARQAMLRSAECINCGLCAALGTKGKPAQAFACHPRGMYEAEYTTNYYDSLRRDKPNWPKVCPRGLSSKDFPQQP